MNETVLHQALKSQCVTFFDCVSLENPTESKNQTISGNQMERIGDSPCRLTRCLEARLCLPRPLPGVRGRGWGTTPPSTR